MRQKTMRDKDPAEKTVRDIRRETRKRRSLKKRSGSLFRVCVARKASLRCADGKASPRACIKAGRRSSSKQARSGQGSKASNMCRCIEGAVQTCCHRRAYFSTLNLNVYCTKIVQKEPFTVSFQPNSRYKNGAETVCQLGESPPYSEVEL